MSQPSAKNLDNFFEIQRYRKRLSWMFFGLFLGVVFLHILALFVVFVLLMGAVTGEVNLSLWLMSIVVFLLILAVGSWMRAHRLSNSGEQLAQKMGAVRLFISPMDGACEVQYFSTFIRASSTKSLPSSYARLYEFCEQMSLASGIALPMIYVLPHEPAVNACVAGEGRRTALIVTQGALDKLDNEQLYALIAHEYGHILHGDAGFNIRLSVMMAGLSLIYESAEWLEVKLLGEFDVDYYERYHAPMHHAVHNVQFAPDVSLVSFADARQWLMHTQGRASLSADDIKNFRREAKYMAKDAVLVPSLFLMGFLVLYRMIGVFGMASHEWLCQRFNRQREFLADATAVQLTRSFAIADLLKDMTHKFDTKIYSTQISAFSYFFFLDPRAEDERFFSSHPKLSERIDAIYQHSFFEFSERVAVCFDDAKLQKATQDVHDYEPISPLVQEIEATVPYFEREFESGFEAVVDGRLVVDDAWREGFLEPKTDVVDAISINRHDSDAPFVGGQLEWLITKHLRHPIGALCVVHGAMLCRYPLVVTNQNPANPNRALGDYHLGDVFVYHPFAQKFENASFDGCAQMLFSHQISHDLLKKIAELPNNHRQSLIVHALKVFCFRLKNPIHKNNGDDLLKKYFDGLLALLSFDSATHDNLLDKKIFDEQKYKINCALIVVFILILLIGYLKKDDNHISKSNHVFIAKFFYDIEHKKSADFTQQCICFLTLFLCSLQSNYFLINQIQTIILNTNRALRLMNIAECAWTNQDIIRCHQMTLNDWSQIIFYLASCGRTVINKTVLSTWQTVLLQDARLDNQEQMTIDLLNMIFDDEFLRVN